MVIFGHICFSIIMFASFFLFFYAAAGSFSLKRLNMNSLAFYFLFFYCFIGTTAIFCGFRNQYLIMKCSEESIDIAYWMIMYALVSLPLFCLLFQYLIGIKNYRVFFDSYVTAPVRVERYESDSTFILFIILGSVGFFALVYTFVNIGYFPQWELVKGNIEILDKRQEITRNFDGNEYVRNILALFLIPNLSYMAFAFMRATKQKKWFILFLVLSVMSVICKTYNFEKSPIVMYFFYFYIIDVLMGNVRNTRKIIIFVVAGALFILFIYKYLFGYEGALISLSSGPMARILITQVAGVFLHVEAFPSMIGFLRGSSFPSALSWIFGSSESWVRSGRVVMETFYSQSVSEGVSGVMNTLYVAEAYANFGIIGCIVAPFFVAFVITIIPTFILKQRKDPFNISVYVIITASFVSCLTGGFIDFFYDLNLVILIIVFLTIKSLANKWSGVNEPIN